MAGISDAPRIAGFTALDVLGSGGFADVYLYEQQMPRRRVAVKVLRDRTLSADSQQQFESEANVMAELSTHPYIVTIHAASVTVDGRPFLVMEYYPGPSLGRRYRQQPLPVEEALRIGVQMCGAIETAHRSRILHRDLKPANILTSAYGRPGLTDFGISVVKGNAAAVEGMSVPWSPPELLDEDGQADERSDVYSLAATVYSLLAGRSPFEVPGGRNDAMSLTARIHEGAPARIGRDDVPPSLERALQVAMAKSPAARPASALEFGRKLQEIESELRLNRTDLDVIEVPEAWPAAPASEADPDGTRYRAPRTVEADTRLRDAPVAGEGETRLRPRAVDPAGTIEPASQAAPSGGDVAGPSRSRPVALLVAAGLLGVVAVGGAIALTASGAGDGSGSQPQATPSSVVDLNAERTLVAPPEEVTVAFRGADAVASWEPAPDWQDGDWYVYTATGDSLETGTTRVENEGPVTIAGAATGGQVCVKVSHRRDGADSSPFAVGCAVPG